MSYVMAAPDMMTSAATDLAAVGSTLSAAHLAAAAPTVAVTPAAADEVSASIAHLFSKFGHGYQTLAGQAAAFHEQFVQRLTAGTGSYAAAEGTNVASLQSFTASSGASANATAASSGTSLPAFVLDLSIFARDLLLVPINFFIFLIHSGVPFKLFGVVIFPGF